MTRRQIANTVTAATCAMVLAAAAAPGAWARAEQDALVQIEKYCSASWRNARIDLQEWDDCTQQTIVDLLTRIPRERLSEAIGNPDSQERRELTRSIWCTVQRMRRARNFLPLEPALVADREAPAVSDNLEANDLWQLIASDEAKLTSRQQQVVSHVLEGMSVAEIAEAMDIPPARVSDEKYKAVQKLRRVADPDKLCA